MLVAVAIMGKAGFDYLKRLFLIMLRRHGPARRVSKTRYRIGLGMFILPLLVGLLEPYFGNMSPLYQAYPLQITIASDAIFVCSLFMLGGEFWDKLRALFIHEAKANLPGKSI